MAETQLVRNEKGQFLPGQNHWSTIRQPTRKPNGQFLPGIKWTAGLTKYCKNCDKPFVTNIIDSIFCSDKCGNQWRQPFRKDIRELRQFWGESGRFNLDLIHQSEVFVAKEVLPKHGFYDIVHMEPIARHFLGDVLARRENRNCMVEVSLEMIKKIRPSRRFVYKWLGLSAFVCHVKPSLDWYCLKELEVEKVPSSTCKGAVRRLMNGEKEGVFLPLSVQLHLG